MDGSAWVMLALYIWWEIVPASILLMLFWNVGKKYKTVVIGSTTAPRDHDDFVLEGREKNRNPRLGVVSYSVSYFEPDSDSWDVHTGENTGFFSNDFRYDSDSDELVGLMGTPGSYHTPYATSPATGVINSSLGGHE